jgi:hypothetical protein
VCFHPDYEHCQYQIDGVFESFVTLGKPKQ